MTEDCQCGLCDAWGACTVPASAWIEYEDIVIAMCQDCRRYCLEYAARGY